MTSIPRNLLRDLAVLVRRHPSRNWLSLATILEDDNTRAQLVALLKEAGASTRPNASKEKKVTSAKPRTALSSLGGLELELSRTPIARLRYLAKGHGIPFSPKDSRERLRGRILAFARKGDIKIGNKPELGGSQGDYAKWADIIIRGGQRR
jgi:hypothetical protein